MSFEVTWEEELKDTPDFWGWMISKRSRLERHTNNQKSALRLLSKLAHPRSKRKNCVVDLQRQMIDEGKSLTERAAGKELEGELTRERERFQKEVASLKEEMKEAVKMRD